MTFNQYSSGELGFFELKESITKLENFFLLYSVENKYDICQFWQYLEQKKLDPVEEYAKSMEIFDKRYRPNSDDLFLIFI